MVKQLRELLDPSEGGRQLVDEWVARATNQVEILNCTPEDGARCLTALQVTTRSPMGAVAYGTGGIRVDNGWLRVLGAGCTRLPRSIASWNGIAAAAPRLPGALLVGDDVLGGFFAINGGRFTGEQGSVHYFANDTLAWEDLELGYSEWLQWLFTGDLEPFYEGQRWQTWREDSRELPGDMGISVYPFLAAAGPPIDARSRAPVPIAELWSLYVQDLAQTTSKP
jgi:hypothetical protein